MKKSADVNKKSQDVTIPSLLVTICYQNVLFDFDEWLWGSCDPIWCFGNGFSKKQDGFKKSPDVLNRCAITLYDDEIVFILLQDVLKTRENVLIRELDRLILSRAPAND